MINTRNDVRDFMIAGDQLESGFCSQSDLYMRLITEEVIHETLKAFDSDDIVGIADGIADSIWVIEGFCITLNIDLKSVWQGVEEYIDTAYKDTAKETMNFVVSEYVGLRSDYQATEKLYFIENKVMHLIKELILLSEVLNIPLQAVWDEVARSNKSKISDSGKVIKNEYGKIQKPDTFSPANIEAVLQQHNLV